MHSVFQQQGGFQISSTSDLLAPPAMAEGRRQEEDYVIAFKSGNKLVAVQLLPRIPQPAAITTTFKFSYGVLALVSLLHLAAYWGWRNVVTALVSVYKCAANCKDEKGHIPLHSPGSGTYSNTSIIKVPELGSTCTKDGSHAVYYFNPFAMLFPV